MTLYLLYLTPKQTFLSGFSKNFKACICLIYTETRLILAFAQLLIQAHKKEHAT